MMEDTAKVVVDMHEDPDAGTGEWELMKHKHDKFISQRTGFEQLIVTGKEIVPPKGFKKKVNIEEEKRARRKKPRGRGSGGGRGGRGGGEEEDSDREDEGEV